MKINFTHEILECFKEQYPKEYNQYSDFVQRGFSFTPFHKTTANNITFNDIVSYSNLLEDFTFLIVLITKLRGD